MPRLTSFHEVLGGTKLTLSFVGGASWELNKTQVAQLHMSLQKEKWNSATEGQQAFMKLLGCIAEGYVWSAYPRATDLSEAHAAQLMESILAVQKKPGVGAFSHHAMGGSASGAAGSGPSPAGR